MEQWAEVHFQELQGETQIPSPVEDTSCVGCEQTAPRCTLAKAWAQVRTERAGLQG